MSSDDKDLSAEPRQLQPYTVDARWVQLATAYMWNCVGFNSIYATLHKCSNAQFYNVRVSLFLCFLLVHVLGADGIAYIYSK